MGHHSIDYTRNQYAKFIPESASRAVLCILEGSQNGTRCCLNGVYGLEFRAKSSNITLLRAVSSAAEHRSYTPRVAGSNPAPPTNKIWSISSPCLNLWRVSCRFHSPSSACSLRIFRSVQCRSTAPSREGWRIRAFGCSLISVQLRLQFLSNARRNCVRSQPGQDAESFFGG
jgi:hypothetical protein